VSCCFWDGARQELLRCSLRTPLAVVGSGSLQARRVGRLVRRKRQGGVVVTYAPDSVSALPPVPMLAQLEARLPGGGHLREYSGARVSVRPKSSRAMLPQMSRSVVQPGEPIWVAGRAFLDGLRVVRMNLPQEREIPWLNGEPGDHSDRDQARPLRDLEL
jgi:hypothetical protein